MGTPPILWGHLPGRHPGGEKHEGVLWDSTHSAWKAGQGPGEVTAGCFLLGRVAASRQCGTRSSWTLGLALPSAARPGASPGWGCFLLGRVSLPAGRPGHALPHTASPRTRIRCSSTDPWTGVAMGPRGSTGSWLPAWLRFGLRRARSGLDGIMKPPAGHAWSSGPSTCSPDETKPGCAHFGSPRPCGRGCPCGQDHHLVT